MEGWFLNRQLEFLKNETGMPPEGTGLLVAVFEQPELFELGNGAGLTVTVVAGFVRDVFVEVILVVALCLVERPGLRDLGNDGGFEFSAGSGLGFHLLRDGLLFIRMIKNA